MEKSGFGARAVGRAFAVAALALLTKAAPSLGQLGPVGGEPSDPKIQVGVGGGVSVPISDTKSELHNGVDETGFVLLNLFAAGLPALRFSLTYDRFDFRPTVAAGGNGSARTVDPGHTQIFGGTAGMKLRLLPGPVQPFVMAGVGAFRLHQFINLATGSSATATDTKF